ncbi:hypothetical protein K1T71_012618 [Dendrolimus kikuchii]|uniref:Uncharacterized protein n=1 Tax=Dendrolimus kikuchii TaxID=765133 RepID=A0ACC1CJS5_9NEOP|nr:hypothetical protein K1T71_012618 [Dendrolimus kikuchii]
MAAGSYGEFPWLERELKISTHQRLEAICLAHTELVSLSHATKPGLIGTAHFASEQAVPYALTWNRAAVSHSHRSKICRLPHATKMAAGSYGEFPWLERELKRLFTLETCCGYGYEPARHLHVHPSPEFSRSAESIRTPPQMRCSSRSEPYLPSIGFHGTRTLRQKRKLFPDLSAASSGHFGLPRRTLALKRGNDY